MYLLIICVWRWKIVNRREWVRSNKVRKQLLTDFIVVGTRIELVCQD